MGTEHFNNRVDCISHNCTALLRLDRLIISSLTFHLFSVSVRIAWRANYVSVDRCPPLSEEREGDGSPPQFKDFSKGKIFIWTRILRMCICVHVCHICNWLPLPCSQLSL